MFTLFTTIHLNIILLIATFNFPRFVLPDADFSTKNYIMLAIAQGKETELYLNGGINIKQTWTQVRTFLNKIICLQIYDVMHFSLNCLPFRISTQKITCNRSSKYRCTEHSTNLNSKL